MLPHTQTFTDQMGREVSIPYPPQRIVSLVPSQTELLYALGLDKEVVGQTLFCIHPETQHRSKPRVGGTKQYKFDVIADLKPDLIIGNKEENEEQGIRQLMDRYPVWMSDIKGLDDALDMIKRVGELVGKREEALTLSARIKSGFEALTHHNAAATEVLYLIWRKPWMAAGHHTFIHEMLGRLGWFNVAQGQESRYPELSAEQISRLNPKLILLSSEPYPFKEKHMAELRALCPQARVALVDGELFSWYGSRLQYSVDYFKQLLRELASENT